MKVLFRINRGEITERGLAKVVGVSQPQLHNVLKRKRRLQVDLADRLLQNFNIDLLQLLQMEQSLVLSGTPAQGLEAEPRATEERPASRKGPGREVSHYRAASPKAV